MKTQTLKCGTHRQNRRVWLDNKTLLTDSGFTVGARYDSTYFPLQVKITLKTDAEGLRKVAQKKGTHPIIDLCSSKVGYALGECDRVKVSYEDGFITITPVIA